MPRAKSTQTSQSRTTRPVDAMAEIKHVGRLKNNQRKVIVAYRVIPGENPPKPKLSNIC
mgnify:CR=1 FL=1